MNKGFFGSLFDFSFTSFITTKIVPALYGIWLVGIVLFAVLLMFRGGSDFLGGILLLVFGVIYARVVMETVIVFFRIAEHTRDTAHALRALHPAEPMTDQQLPVSEVRFDTQTGRPLDQP